MEYWELITTGECGDRSEPGIFYDGNDLAWRNGVRLFKGYWALAGEVNFGCCLVMWANHSQILGEYSSTCLTQINFCHITSLDHWPWWWAQEKNWMQSWLWLGCKQHNSPQYVQVWKFEWKNMFWPCLIAQVETAKECAKQCADEAQCNGWSHFAPAKRWTMYNEQL